MGRIGIGRVVACAVAMTLGTWAQAEGQQRPLVTQDPEVIGDGRLLIETGVETGRRCLVPGVWPHG